MSTVKREDFERWLEADRRASKKNSTLLSRDECLAVIAHLPGQGSVTPDKTFVRWVKRNRFHLQQNPFPSTGCDEKILVAPVS